ncbi:hypothetical protein ACQPZF_14850 [Actinosynnema sp. CS-041913]
MVCAGSLPPGSPRDTCVRIVAIARDAGVRELHDEVAVESF